MSRSAVIVLDYARPVPLLQRPRVVIAAVILALVAAASIIYARSPIRTPGFGGGRLVPLQVQYPKPIFVSTPSPLFYDAPRRIPNLEAPNWGPAGTLLVPVGCTNLALHKPATGSDLEPLIGDYSLITDGIAEGTEGNYIELAPGRQWVQIDLGSPARLYAVVLWHRFNGFDIYYDVVVQASNDPQFKSGVTTIFNNDHDNSSGLGAGKDPAYFDTNMGRTIPARGTLARYVRLYSNGSYVDRMNHYTEVEVYGLPANVAVPAILQTIKTAAGK